MSVLTRTGLLLALASIPLLGSTVISSGAGASGFPPTTSPGAPIQLSTPGSAALPATTVESSNWSGYVVTGSTYSSAAATWVQPTATCSSASTVSGTWVGLDGYDDSNVEQTGTIAGCQDGVPDYAAWYETYPSPPVYFGNPVQPGDVMEASVVANTLTSFTMTIIDSTRGWTETSTQKVQGAARTSAEVIVEAPCCKPSGKPLPLADFGTLDVTKAKVNGAAIGTFSPVTVQMVSGSIQKDSVSPLSKNKNFSVTWLHK